MATGWPMKTNYVNGDVWSASDANDITGTINLAAGAQWAAGKNKIINGDFFVNQRVFSSTTTDGAYGFDRFKLAASSGATMSAQTFTPGTAPVSGYEARNFCRIVTTGQSGSGVYTLLEQDIEDVRSEANQTITISFWAKSASGTPKIAGSVVQNFGTGGSPSATVETYVSQSTISTSWARYSMSVAVPSISGKTVGTTANTSYLGIRLWVSAGVTFNTQTGSLGIQSNTFDIWGVQVEAGSTATAFQTASGSIPGELALCQRYLPVAPNGIEVFGYAYASNSYVYGFKFPVTTRVIPTGITVNNIAQMAAYNQGNTAFVPSAVTFNSGGTGIESGSILATATATQGEPGRLGLGATGSIFFTGCEL
jgi:hypothetical protein